MKYLIRLIALPILTIFVLISLLRDTLQIMFDFMKYGGEFVAFKKGYKDTIKHLIEQNNGK